MRGVGDVKGVHMHLGLCVLADLDACEFHPLRSELVLQTDQHGEEIGTILKGSRQPLRVGVQREREPPSSALWKHLQ